jgi:hypothetical protein
MKEEVLRNTALEAKVGNELKFVAHDMKEDLIHTAHEAKVHGYELKLLLLIRRLSCLTWPRMPYKKKLKFLVHSILNVLLPEYVL